MVDQSSRRRGIGQAPHLCAGVRCIEALQSGRAHERTGLVHHGRARQAFTAKLVDSLANQVAGIEDHSRTGHYITDPQGPEQGHPRAEAMRRGVLPAFELAPVDGVVRAPDDKGRQPDCDHRRG